MKRCALVFPLFIASMLFLNLKCKDDGIAPPPSKGPDTTSHDFVWTVSSLGDSYSDNFYDVAIVNDSLAYAVGEVYLKDSTGGLDPRKYNFATWNGKTWKLSRGSSSPFGAVYAFSANDVWTGTSAPYHWDGTTWKGYDITGLFDGYIIRIWGSSSNDVYLVGGNGAMAHFDGTTWKKIESGTTLDVMDIEESGGEIYAVASSIWKGPERLILRVTSTGVQQVSGTNIISGLACLYFIPSKKYYVAGDGIYEKSSLSDPQWKNRTFEITEHYTYSMHGNGENDIMAVGGRCDVTHYNGSTWKSYPELLSNGANFVRVRMRGNLCICVGGRKIAIGRRTL